MAEAKKPEEKKSAKKAAAKPAAKKPEEKKLLAADVVELTDEQVLAELDKLELEAEEGATPEDLRAALKEALESAEAAAVDTAPKKGKSEAKEFKVHDAEGRYIRTYSLEQHGENAGELAEGFASKIGGSIKK